MDDLVNFEEMNVADLLNLEENFYNSKGTKLEKLFWSTMMNNMTDERNPERQFCLVTDSLALKIRRQNQMSEEEIRLVKEIAETENKLSKLREAKEKISISEEHTDEDIAVTSEFEGNNLVSEECQTREGLPINVVYNKIQTREPIKKGW